MVAIKQAHAHLFQMLQQRPELEGWTITWDRSRKRAGACVHHKKRLVFSAEAVSRYGWDDVENLFLHEAAHALVGPDHGHGKTWRKKAKELGYEGGAYARDWETQEQKENSSFEHQAEAFLFVASALVALWMAGWHAAVIVLAVLLVTAVTAVAVAMARPVLSDRERYEIETTV